LDLLGWKVILRDLWIPIGRQNLDVLLLTKVFVVPVIARADLDLDGVTADRILVKRFDVTVPDIILYLGLVLGNLIYETGMQVPLAGLAMLDNYMVHESSFRKILDQTILALGAQVSLHGHG
jgi:hypothetical protein